MENNISQILAARNATTADLIPTLQPIQSINEVLLISGGGVGEPGPQGEKGDKGDTGDTGPQGIPGTANIDGGFPDSNFGGTVLTDGGTV